MVRGWESKNGSQGFGLRVQGLGFRVHGLGFRVRLFESTGVFLFSGQWPES